MPDCFELLELKKSGDGCEARVRVPAASPWFEGHFPHEPLVPGIAQVELVLSVLEQARGHRVHPRLLKNVRFRTPVPPDSELVVQAGGFDTEGCLRFKLLLGDATVCNGTLAIEDEEASDA
jgi:3-hydroxymyristoyl/3-hydroxydecanoyl-(acyl carrier protein) dehydratase